jgi:recombinational DNA repair ATPase RecF
MKLNKVEIKNFRSIENVTIDFENDNCRVLVGINESGKSNILRALSMLGATKPISSDVRFTNPQEESIEKAYVKFFLTLETKELAEVYEIIKEMVLTIHDNSLYMQSKSFVGVGIRQFVEQFRDVIFKVDLLEKQKYLILSAPNLDEGLFL